MCTSPDILTRLKSSVREYSRYRDLWKGQGQQEMEA